MWALISTGAPTKGNYGVLGTPHWFVEYIICRPVWCTCQNPIGNQKGLTLPWLLSNNHQSVFLKILFALLIHRICASLQGWLYICLRSACVTISPSHSRAKPQFRNWGTEWWRTWSILGLVDRGLWRSEKPLDIQYVTQRRAVSRRPDGRVTG